MATAEQLKAMIESFAAKDEPRFYRLALQLAAEEARRGRGRVAQELRDLIDAVRTGNIVLPAPQRRPVPIAQARTDLGELVAVSYPDLRFSDIVLADDLRASLERVLRESRSAQALAEHGLRPRRRLLLVGPPGTGKTLTARIVAGELHLPLYEVRLESLITRYMGETAAKLRLIFDAMNSVRGVYLFDEFDAIGAQRALPNEVGEIRRVLNSFLQFIERDDSASIVIAATNHAEILDRALVRRFDDVLTYALPEREQVVATLRRALAGFKIGRINWEQLASAADGLSYADIVRAAEDAAKDMVLDDRPTLDPSALERALAARVTAHTSVARGR